MNVSNLNLTELACAVQQGNYALTDDFCNACYAWVRAEIVRKNYKFDGYSESFNDFVQEAVAHIWNKLNKYNPDISEFTTWLTAVVEKKYCNDRKKTREEISIYTEGEDGEQQCLIDNLKTAESPEELVLEKHFTASIMESLKKLPDNQGRALYLSGQGYKPAKIAELMGVKSEDVSRWLNRGRTKLKKDLEREEALSRDGFDRAA